LAAIADIGLFVAASTQLYGSGCRSIHSPRQLFDAEWGLLDDTRHTVSPTSPAISNPPVPGGLIPVSRSPAKAWVDNPNIDTARAPIL